MTTTRKIVGGRLAGRWVVAALIVGALLCAGASAAAATLGSLRAGSGRSTPAGFVRIPGEVAPAIKPALARGALRQVATATDASSPLTLTLTLRRTRQAAFERFLAAVENRHSPQFRHFLTQPQLAARFGPSTTAYDDVLGWLRSEGFSLVQGSVNRLTITVRGTRAQAERAFDVQLREYAVRGGGRLFANAEDPALPSAIATDVEDVSGLSNLDRPAFSNPVDPAVGKPGIAIDYAFCLLDLALANLSYNTNGYFGGKISDLAADCQRRSNNSRWPFRVSGRSLRIAALAPRITDGSGQKIGLLEFDTFEPSDVANYVSLVGLPASAESNLSETPVNGGVASPGSGESEVLLDIDTVLTIAPGARVVVYDAPSSTSWQTLFNAMIGDGDTVISNSWSSCEDQVSEADAQSIDQVLQNAAASGISVLNGSGDSGSTCLDGSADTIGVPADSPNATAVGGTSLTNGPEGTYESEQWWDGATATPQTGQGGFGVSRYFTRPSYQQAYTSSTMRSIPDVAVNADPADGYAICEADAGGCPTGLSYGGTSAATPMMAAFTALLNQLQGSNLGALNPLLYPLGATDAFHDAASMGSDFAHVGLGSPNVDLLSLALRGATAGPVDAATSYVVEAEPDTQADGSSADQIVVYLRDADGNLISGKTVSLTANAGSSATVTPVDDVTSVDNGAAIFDVTDTTAEQVTLTATDTTDDLALAPLTIDFVPPVATGAEISAGPSTVPDDGTTQATISVYLQNSLAQPASGKTVTLSQTGSATITPAGSSTPGDTAVTGANGYATFTATDTNAETVQFTAIDTTDGNLPVPGSASVTFYSGTPPTCANSPTTASGYGIETFASPFAYDPYVQYLPGNFSYGSCGGALPPVFNSSGDAYIADAYTGTINELPPGGGTASQTNQLPDANFGEDNIEGLAFGQDGELYAALWYPPGSGFSVTSPEIVQLDPTTGAILRVVATGAGGLPDCPWGMAVDPLTGDLFVAGECTGYAYSGEVARISDPSSSSATVSSYAYVGGIGQDGVPHQLAFAPDGTLYTSVGGDEMVEISGTNQPQPATVTQLVQYTSNYGLGVAVTASNNSGAATQLEATDLSGYVYSIDLTQNPPVVSTIVSPAASGGIFDDVTLGPDSCLYVAAVTEIDRLGEDGCGSSGNESSTPSITVEQTSGTDTPATGSSVGFTATLNNVSSPSGTPVEFEIDGANEQVKLVDADGSGTATASYSGVFQGVDTITASTVVGGQTLTSAPVQVHWQAGKDTTFLDLNASPTGGSVGQASTVTATLYDVAQSPPAPISGQTVSLDLNGQTCSPQTNGSGVASCQLTPGSAGLLPLTAGYAGDSSYTPTTAANEFDATVPSGRSTSTAVSCNPTTITVGSTTTCKATVTDTASGTAITPTGTVGFSSDSSGSFNHPGNSCTLSASGASASCTVDYTPSAVGSGTHTITALYGGDANHASSQNQAKLTVHTASTGGGSGGRGGSSGGASTPTAVSVASSANPSTTGQAVTYTATVAPPPAGGTVAFTDGGATIAGCAAAVVDATSGDATCNVTYTAPGSHDIEAGYSGYSSYGTSSSPILVQVVVSPGAPKPLGTSTRLRSSAGRAVTGERVSYIASVTPSPGGGTVSFLDHDQTIAGCGAVELGPSGAAVCTVVYAQPGRHLIQTAYSGDASDTSSQSKALLERVRWSLTVRRAPRETAGVVELRLYCARHSGGCWVISRLGTVETIQGDRTLGFLAGERRILLGARSRRIAAGATITLRIPVRAIAARLLAQATDVPTKLIVWLKVGRHRSLFRSWTLRLDLRASPP